MQHDIDARAAHFARVAGKMRGLENPSRRRRRPSMSAGVTPRVAGKMRRDGSEKSLTASAFTEMSMGLSKSGAGWQDDAWRFYRVVPEAGYAADYVGHALGRVRVFPAVRLDPGADPLPLDAVDDDGQPVVPDQLRASIEASFAAIRSDEESLPEMQERFGAADFVAGETFLIGIDNDHGTTEYRIHSSSEVAKVTGEDRWVILDHPGQRPHDATRIPDDAVNVRILDSDPEWRNLPKSSLRRVLDICEELVLLSGAIRATALARIAGAGILVIPRGTVEAGPSPVDGESEDDYATAELIKLAEHMATAVGDPSSVARLVPFILALDVDDAAKVQLIETTRDIDRLFGEQRQELIRRFAGTVDLPPEVLLGYFDSNHWNVWKIGEDEWRVHIAPRVARFCRHVTAGLFQPMLQAAGVDDPRICLWYDGSDLVEHPDRTDIATVGVEHGLISPAVWRREAGFEEEDAPSGDDLDLLTRVGVLTPTASDAANVTEGPPELTASALESDVGDRLAEADRSLIDRVLTAADQATRRALERAGAKLRTKALKANAALRDTLSGVPNERVAAALGPTLVAAAVDETELLEGEFDQLRDRWVDWTGRVHRLVRQELYDAGLTEQQVEDTVERLEESRDEAWLLLLALLTANARILLYGHGSSEPVGETDPGSLVPPSIVRQAVAAAGGAQIGSAGTVSVVGNVVTANPTAAAGGAVIDAAGVPASSGVATGPFVIDAFARAQTFVQGWRWVYGDPALRASNYAPHLALNGAVFTSWTDTVLAHSGWPGFGHLFPGDHRGCLCLAAPILVPQPPEGAALQ